MTRKARWTRSRPAAVRGALNMPLEQVFQFVSVARAVATLSLRIVLAWLAPGRFWPTAYAAVDLVRSAAAVYDVITPMPPLNRSYADLSRAADRHQSPRGLSTSANANVTAALRGSADHRSSRW
jgi:hypothetical protein